MVLIDSETWDKDITYYGEDVTIRTVTDSSHSDYGDATESTSDEENVKAIVDDITAEEQKQFEGVFPNSDKRFFLLSDQANISEGNRIVHDSQTYEIVKVMKRQTGGITISQEAWGKKI